MTIAFQFLRTELVWLPAAAVLLSALLWLHDRRRAKRSAQWLGARHPWLSEAAAGSWRPVRRICFALGLVLAALAAMGPSFGGSETLHEDTRVDLVVCLDVSRSMQAVDQAPDRLRFAKAALERLVDTAAGQRLGLVLFAGEARRWTPLTADGPAFLELLAPVEPALIERGGTDLGQPLHLAQQLFDGQRVDAPQVLLLSDGEDHAGAGLAAARRLAERGIAVHVVGFGTARGAKIPVPAASGGTGYLKDRQGREVVTRLDDTGLRAIAAAGGGRYIAAEEDERPLVTLYEEAIRPQAVTTNRAAERSRRRDDYPWFLVLAWCCFGLHLALTDRRR